MNLNNYKLLKIPFVSKKKTGEILGYDITSKYSFSGTAYYLVDSNDNCIVWERAIIKDAEYRPTDPAMLVTDYYKSYFIRKNIERKDILGWSDDDYQVKTATQEMIDKVNHYSLHHTRTVLSIEGVISGSNPTGSDSNINKSPILIDPRMNSDYIRFVNAIKRIRCHDTTFEKALKEVLENVSDIERVFPNEITLEELISLNEMFGKWIKIFNSDINDFTEDQSGIMEYINDINQKEIRNSVEHVIAMYENKLIQENKLVEKLRREFRVSLIKEAIENNYSEYAGDDELSIFDTEAAHILGVSEIRSNELELSWIANPNNGLLLSPKLHTILDKHKIKLNTDGTFESVSDEYDDLSKYKIDDSILNEERIEFIRRRNEFEQK